MIPKSAVAERATITRLCAFLPRRSLINISVLRHHGGFRRDDHPVSRGIADHRDPGLEEKRDLDRDLATARCTDTRAVPDGSGVWNGRGRRAWTAAGSDAGIDREGEAPTKFALHGAHHLGVCWQRRIERDGSPGAFSGRVRDRVVDVNRAPQIDGAQQQHEEDRREHGELDHRLTAVAAQKALSHQYSALNTALVLMVNGLPIRLPMIGVMKKNW